MYTPYGTILTRYPLFTNRSDFWSSEVEEEVTPTLKQYYYLSPSWFWTLPQQMQRVSPFENRAIWLCMYTRECPNYSCSSSCWEQRMTPSLYKNSFPQNFPSAPWVSRQVLTWRWSIHSCNSCLLTYLTYVCSWSQWQRMGKVIWRYWISTHIEWIWMNSQDGTFGTCNSWICWC